MLNRKVILVTGASSGFGKIMAGLLANQGHIVYGTSRKAMDNRGKVQMLQMDVTDKMSVQQVAGQVVVEQGRIDVLVNNAGMGIGGALELATEEEIALQMNTNFFGVVNMCNAVLPHMRAKRKGHIINISSIGGLVAVPFQGFYSASKFAVEGYTEALAHEVYPFDIKVSMIEPGDFNTNFTANRTISTRTLQHKAYKTAFARTMEIIEKAEHQGCAPVKLGKAVCKLVNSKHPPLRLRVGPMEQVLFAGCKGILPGRLMQWIVRFFYDVKKQSV
ncbi:MAG: SDR family oxidoreductase [Tannerellaceae bacterium]